MKLCFFVLLVCLPLKHLRVSSSFGYRKHPIQGVVRFHEGVDLRARHDTVFAVLDGEVAKVALDPGLGLNIRLQHHEVEITYGHLAQAFVAPGDAIVAGQPVGITGATGRVTGEHLHFTVRFRAHYLNPLLFLKKLLQ